MNDEIVGRNPLAKTVTDALSAAHPTWSDEQIADRINLEYETPVITAQEVAHWRAAAGSS